MVSNRVMVTSSTLRWLILVTIAEIRFESRFAGVEIWTSVSARLMIDSILALTSAVLTLTEANCLALLALGALGVFEVRTLLYLP